MIGNRDLLEPAIEATRRALRRMDDESVPFGLRKLSAKSDRRLNAPDSKRVLDELAASEWLRDKALEQWDEVPATIEGSRVAAEGFLRRTDGWEETMRIESLESLYRDALAMVARLGKEKSVLESRIGELRAQIKKERSEAEKVLGETVRQAVERGVRDDAAAEVSRQRVKDLESALAITRGEKSELVAGLEEADLRIAFLLEHRAVRSNMVTSSRSDAFGHGAPLVSAQTLDRLAVALEASPADAVPDPVPGLAIPKELRPDYSEAIVWLLSVAEPTTVLVDGYNVSHAIGATSDALGRERVRAICARLRRLASAPMTVRLFWDSGLGVDSARGRSGVLVSFVGSADDSIVEAVRNAKGFTVVVTSDREVRERSEGAFGVWSEALSDWL